jgi:release factor glutamine methyltransferase
MKICLACNEDNPQKARFCLGCGTPISPPDALDTKLLRFLVKREPKTVEDLLELGKRVLADSSHLFEGHDHAYTSRHLLSLCLGGANRVEDETYSPNKRVRERYLSLIARRAAGEPLPLITGHITFYGLDFSVKPGEFIPRSSSEWAVSRVLLHAKEAHAPIIVDLCTGTGPIALAVAKNLKRSDVWGTDISDVALSQARRNARRLQVSNVTFRRGDMYSHLPPQLKQRVDVITGYIPYIPPADIRDMPAETREYEPLYSLTDLSHDGLGLMRRAIFEASAWLRVSGWLLLETDEETAPKLQEMCNEADLVNQGCATQGSNVTVVVEAQRPTR